MRERDRGGVCVCACVRVCVCVCVHLAAHELKHGIPAQIPVLISSG